MRIRLPRLCETHSLNCCIILKFGLADLYICCNLESMGFPIKSVRRDPLNWVFHSRLVQNPLRKIHKYLKTLSKNHPVTVNGASSKEKGKIYIWLKLLVTSKILMKICYKILLILACNRSDSPMKSTEIS